MNSQIAGGRSQPSDCGAALVTTRGGIVDES
jgi:hypothetical protein